MARQKTATAAIRFEANLDTLKSQLKDARKIVSEFQEGTRLTLSADDKNMFKGLLESLSGVETKIDAINTAAKNSTIDEVFKKMGMSAEELKSTLDGITAKLDGLSKLKTSVKDTFDSSVIAGFKTELKGLNEQFTALNTQFQQISKSSADPLEQIKKEEAELAKLQKRLQSYQQTKKDIQRKIDASNARSSKIKDTVTGLDNIDAVKAKKQEIEQQLKDTEKNRSQYTQTSDMYEKLSQDMNMYKRQILDLQAAEDKLNNTFDEAKYNNAKNKMHQGVEKYKNTLAEKLNNTNADIEAQEKLISTKISEINNLKANFLTADEIQKLREGLFVKEQEVIAQEELNKKVTEAVAKYEEQRAIVTSLLEQQKELSALQGYKAPDPTSKEEAQKILVQKAKEFNEIISKSPTITDEVHKKLQIIATDMKNIVSDPRWKTIKEDKTYGITTKREIGLLDSADRDTYSAYAKSMEYAVDTSNLASHQEILSKAMVEAKEAETIIRQNASVVEQITGRTVQNILGVAEAQNKASTTPVVSQFTEEQAQKLRDIAEGQRQVSQAATDAGQAQVQADIQSNTSLEEKLALLKQLKTELKFLETAEDKRVDMEEHAWDAGGNNPKSEADSLNKIKKYEELVEHIGTANAAIDNFQNNYEELIITMKKGEQIRLGTNDLYDLTGLKLDARQIKDISFIPYQESTEQAVGQVGATVGQIEKLEQSAVDAATKIETLEQKVTELNQKGSTNTTDEQIKQIGEQASGAATKMETLEQQVVDLNNKVNSSAGSEEIQKIGEAATTANTKIESLEQNVSELISKLDGMASAMGAIATASQNVTNANVTGTVNVGNKVPVTGGGGEQLALEKTLRATYSIQQNMVKILSEINAKMVSGANAATASYEQLRAVMTETVDAAKNLGAEEEKQVKKSGNAKSNEHYAIMKKNLQEVLRLKKQLPKAGEQETQQIKSQIKRLNERARYHQKAIKDANAIIPIRQQEVDILREQAKIQDAINADTRKKVAATAKKNATKELESSYNTTRKTLRSVGDGELMASEESQTVQELITKFKEYDALLAAVSNKFEDLSNRDQQNIQESIDKFNQLTQAQKEAFKAGAYNTYNKSGKYKGELTDLSQDSSLSGIKGQVDSGAISRQAALEQIAASTVKARIETVQYDEATGQLTARFRDQQKNLQEIKIAFQDVGNATRHTTQTVEQYQNAFGKMFGGVGKKLKELLRYFSAFTIVMRVINSIKQGVTVVREMNTALTEMKLVTESTTDEMARAEKQIQKVASTVASTNVDIAKSATDWAKLGYSMSDALELAGVSAKYAKVGFTDVATASENLTATLQAFYSKDLSQGLVDAGDLAGTITDKFVLVGNKFASSAEGLGRGMTEAGSALVAANNSLDESLALITAGTTVLQDESETANAVRTISLRLRGTKASELEEMGETDLTGVIEDTSKLYKIVKDMTSVNGKEGVEIFNPDTQAYKSTYEIMLEISKVWDEMTDVQRAGLLETIAGWINVLPVYTEMYIKNTSNCRNSLRALHYNNGEITL